MRTNTKTPKQPVMWLVAAGLSLHIGAAGAYAQPAAHNHGDVLYHKITAELAGGVAEGATGLASWDVDGWYGGDSYKLWLKSEGEYAQGHVEAADVWAMLSRNIHPFWDVQAGVHQQFQPHSTTRLVVGAHGTAPFFLETDAHVFVDDNGTLALRIKQQKDLLFSQKLALEPYYKLYATSADSAEGAAGLNSLTLGTSLRYAISPKVAPYSEVFYTRHLGETAGERRKNGENVAETTLLFGVKLMF